MNTNYLKSYNFIFEEDHHKWPDPQSRGKNIFTRNKSYKDLIDELDSYQGIRKLLEVKDVDYKDVENKLLLKKLKIIESSKENGVFIFTSRRLAKKVYEGCQKKGILVKGFIDNNKDKWGELVNGLEVHSLDNIDKSEVIFLGTTIYTSTLLDQLEKAGCCNVVPYSYLTLWDKAVFSSEIPYIDIHSDLILNKERYFELFLNLEDDKSRVVLDGIILYRMTLDPRHARNIADEYASQYFDSSLVEFDSRQVFYDIGGYDGDTAYKYKEISQENYSKIYIFEPENDLLEKAKDRSFDDTKTFFIPAGMYSKPGTLKFSSSGLTNGFVSEVGDIEIKVEQLDCFSGDTPTFIKMDIEGSESAALEGGVKLIQESKPLLAIAAYHFGCDLWKLSDQMLSIQKDYRLYLRHYSETGLETVIYAK